MLYHFLPWVLGLTFLFLSTDVCSQKRCGQQRMPNVRSSSPWPWMVAITVKDRPTGPNNYQMKCSGFLIDFNHVITVAQCVTGEKNLADFQASIGHVDLTRGERYSIVSIVTHENYSKYSFNNDIAMLTLDRPVTEPGFNPVCLPTEEIRRLNLDDERATVVSWGGIRYRDDVDDIVILQQLKGVPVLSNEQCEQAFRAIVSERTFRKDFPEGFTNQIMCAGFLEGGKDVCEGASGGPVMIYRNNSWHVVGMLTFRFGCGMPGIPAGFVRVSEFFQWILENAFKY